MSSDLLKTWTNLNLFPIILDALKIFLTCSGVALVAMSKSFGSNPHKRSLTHPPTRYPSKLFLLRSFIMEIANLLIFLLFIKAYI